MIYLEDKVGVLGQLWINYREDKDMEMFLDYNDIGLPLAYFKAEGLVTELTPLGEQYIDETFDMFLDAMKMTEKDVEALEEVTLESIMIQSFMKNNPEGKQN